MLVSSTSMNAAIATTTAISHGLNCGVHATGAAAAVAGATGGGPGTEAPAVGVDAMNRKPQMRTMIRSSDWMLVERPRRRLFHEDFGLDGHSEPQRMV